MTQDQIYNRCYARERVRHVAPLDMYYHPGQEWRTQPKPGELEYLAWQYPIGPKPIPVYTPEEFEAAGRPLIGMIRYTQKYQATLLD